jgi:hypothetical protein
MSKKLIAVASAAALALSALVAVPATAATFAVTDGTNAYANGATSDSPITVAVPSANSITSTGTRTALEFEVTKVSDASTLTVTSTGGVKLLTAAQMALTGASVATVATGTQSITDTSTASAVTFWVYTTSTTAGTVVVNNGGNSKTFYVEGTSTVPYKIAFSGPASAAISGVTTITGTVKDAFGNHLTTALTNSNFVVSALGGDKAGAQTYDAATTPVAGEYVITHSTTTDVYTIKTLNRSDAGPMAVSVKLASDPTKVDAFGDFVASSFFQVNSVDLAARVAELETQIATMRPKANSVTKKRYNTLARKWNAAFPSQKVKLKK